MTTNLSRRQFLAAAAGTAALGAAAFALTGCGGSSSEASGSGEPRTKVKIGYWSECECDCSTIAAFAMGAFEEQGLEPELALVDYNTWPAQVANGDVDIMMVSGDSFNHMAEGAELVLVNGSHTGCSSYVTRIDDDSIKEPKDLVGKTIGVDAEGGLGQVLLISKMQELGVENPYEAVTWKVYDPSAFIPALQSGEIDCFGYWDPIPTMAVDQGIGKMLFRMNEMEPYTNVVCCYEGIAKRVVENEPELAVKLNAAFVKGTEYCRDQPAECAKLLCDEGFFPEEDLELTTRCLEVMTYWTDPADAERSLRWWLELYQNAGTLAPGADIDEVMGRCFKDANQLGA